MPFLFIEFCITSRFSLFSESARGRELRRCLFPHWTFRLKSTHFWLSLYVECGIWHSLHPLHELLHDFPLPFSSREKESENCLFKRAWEAVDFIISFFGVEKIAVGVKISRDPSSEMKKRVPCLAFGKTKLHFPRQRRPMT